MPTDMTTPSTPDPTHPTDPRLDTTADVTSRMMSAAMPEASRHAAGVLLGYMLRDGHTVEEAATQAAALIEGIRQDTLRFAENEALMVDAIGLYPREVSDRDWLFFCCNDLHTLSHTDRRAVVDWLRFQREGLPETDFAKRRRLAREAQEGSSETE